MVLLEEKDSVVSILGSDWSIVFRTADEDDALKNDCFGYADDCLRMIIILKCVEPSEPLDIGMPGQSINQKRVLRHEIIHAFLSESGLAVSSLPAESWAINEEMVDWFARMSPKIFDVYKSLEIL